MKSDNSELFWDCDTLLSLMGTLAGSANLNWSVDGPIGLWNGITVGGSPERVTGLALSKKGLTGSIPSGLGDLSGLTTLNLSDNGITGSIPSGLGDLSSLVTLNLSTNQLSGAIPSELGDLSSLTTLDLSTNQLHHVIPSELGDLSSLSTLNLSKNGLTGSIPSELGDLSSLITLNLSENDLTGSIPSGLGGLSSLSTLNLSDNELTGSIPSKLGNLSSLTELKLFENNLDWEIPEELNQLDNLREVDLRDNFGLIGPAHLNFTGLSKAYLGYMETETWAVANFSSATAWSLSGGTDSGKFAITIDGVLTFSSAPDFDARSNPYSVEVTASVGGNSLNRKTAQIEVKVMDRDFALSVSPGSIVEEGQSTQFDVTATRDGVTNQATSTTVTLSLAGSAGADDYATTTLNSITIPANSASATTTLTLDPTNDDIVEGDEVVKVVGASGDQAVSPAWITIDDKGDEGTLSLSGPDTVAEGSDASFTVTLSHAIGPEVTVEWSVMPGSATSTDYDTSSGTLTFPGGSAANATTTLTLIATDDLLSEVEESFTVMLGTVTGDISDRISVDAQANSAEVKIEASDEITVTLLGDSNVDEGASATYTVSLSPNGVTPTAALTVDYATAGGTAGSGDYEGVSGTWTFTSFDTAAKTVTVQTTVDSIAEGDETFSFGLANVAGGGGQTPSLGNPITTTIDDDDPEPTSITLSVSRTEVSEGDGMATTTLTATLEGGTTRNATTTVALSLSGTATATGSGADYTAVVPLEMTIPAEAATGTASLIITPTNDEIVEGEETIRVEGTVSNFTVSPAEITINDGDVGTLSLSGSVTEVLEGGDASYTVSLSRAIAHDVTVGWSVTPDSGDFSTPSGSVTFAAGSPANATTTLTLTATDDLLSEVEESFTVSLGTVTGDISDLISVDADANSAGVTIEPSDPIRVIISGPSNVDEGESATYTVSLDPNGVTPTAALTVDYATGDDDDTADSGDYESATGTLTFTSSDAAAKTVTVQTTVDSIAEGDETFSFGLSNVAGGGGQTPSLGNPITTTIDDDDPEPTSITLSVSPTEVSEGDGSATSIVVTATLDGDSTRATSTTVTLSLAGSASGLGADYTVGALPTVTILAGNPTGTATLIITPTDDEIVEVDETIVVQGTASLTVSSASITILDNDTEATRIILSVNPTDVSEGDGRATSITVTATLDGGTTRATSTTVTLSLSGSASGLGADYTVGALPTVTILAGNLTGTASLSITPTDDEIVEGDETIVVHGRANSLTISSASITILDNDTEATRIILSVNPTEVSEGDGRAISITVTATLDGGANRNSTATVTLSLSGTATGSGADYTVGALPTVTILAGSPTGTASLSITPTDDEIVEGDETIVVQGTASGLMIESAAITVLDHKGTGPHRDTSTLSLSGPGAAVVEGSDATFTVTLSDPIAHPVTVKWSVTPDSGDFSTTSGSVTFAAGSSANATTTLTLTPTDDDLSEGEESLTVSLGAIASDISDQVSVDPLASSAVVTVAESDPITVTLSGDSSVEEGGSATYTVSLSPAGVTPTAALTVDYDTSGGSAGSGDYEGVLGTLTFTSSYAGNKTVTVQTTGDSIEEGSETFSFELSDVSGGGGPTPSLGSPSSITTTIIDDDRRLTQRPPANNAPTFNEGATTTRAALENSEVGTEVGEPVRATDRDGDRLEYRLRGTDRASFHLDPRTGQLTTALLLDYETQSEYSVRVRVRDGEGGSDGIDVTITVVDLDEAPSQPGAPEVRSTGPTGLAVSWTAPDNQGPEITDYDVRYREAGGEFQDAEFVGADTSITLNNLKPGTSYEVQVRAVNAEGASPWSESGRDETEEAPPTPAPTPSPEPTPSSSSESTPTPTSTPISTPAPEPTPTPTPESTPTPTPTPESTPTPTPTLEPTPRPALKTAPPVTPTPTPEPTVAPTSTATPTETAEPTAMSTPAPAFTSGPTGTPVPTPTLLPVATPTTEPTAPPTSAPKPTRIPVPVSTDATALAPTPTPTVELVPPEGDVGDGGFPWWVIVVVVIGVVAGVVLIVGVRRSRR